jgi:hypothetical protein
MMGRSGGSAVELKQCKAEEGAGVGRTVSASSMPVRMTPGTTSRVLLTILSSA